MIPITAVLPILWCLYFNELLTRCVDFDSQMCFLCFDLLTHDRFSITAILSVPRAHTRRCPIPSTWSGSCSIPKILARYNISYGFLARSNPEAHLSSEITYIMQFFDPGIKFLWKFVFMKLKFILAFFS